MKILLADDKVERVNSLVHVLAADSSLTIIRLKQHESLADAVAAVLPDVVLVDMMRPDRDALEGIQQLTATHPRPVMPFADEGDPSLMAEAVGNGVSLYSVQEMGLPDVQAILRVAVAVFGTIGGREKI
ncbi:ANTAR domain-containing response regulator [Rhodopila sp.]|uniref:ANTAR domain-containing response regulator n=1 Tax=Rhodopila sp. TaxID=2480087 RepID=UPI003D144A95